MQDRISSVDRLRSLLEEGTREVELRKAVLQGAFNALPQTDFLLWKLPTFKLMIFLSSTFTDTAWERNILNDELLPELRALGQREEIPVAFVDMRWGVRDENTCDHNTWIECKQGIRYCYEESNSIFLLSLQGDKYGYRPLPKEIAQSQLETFIKRQECSEDILAQIFSWYRLDGSRCPPAYVLQPLERLDDPNYWQQGYPTILSALNGLCFDANDDYVLRVGESVTEWEVRYAIGMQRSQESSPRLLWSRRTFELDTADEFFVDAGNRDRCNDLLSYMTEYFTEENMCRYEDRSLPLSDYLRSLEGSSQLSAAVERYRSQFQSFITQKLHSALDQILVRKQRWRVDGGGLGLSGEVLGEMLHHSSWAFRKCQSFTGREALLAQAVEMVQKGRDVNQKAETAGSFGAICLAIIGPSGCGKTALMAKLASELYRVNDIPHRPVLIRFCGTSGASRNARGLVVSLCLQIAFLHGVFEATLYSSLVQMPYADLIQHFHDLLRTYPIVLLVDSLDQLSDEDLGRSQISFLKHLDKVHPDTRIVVSCLPDDLDQRSPTARPSGDDNAISASHEGTVREKTRTTINRNESQEKKYVYLCEERIREGYVPRIDLVPEGHAESWSMLIYLLQLKGRQIPVADQESLCQKLETLRPSVLYLSLFSVLLSRFTDGPEFIQSPLASVHDLIRHLFRALERQFGELLVQRALAFLTYAEQGVSDQEMEDLLSLDEEVLDFVFQYNVPTIRRLPSHVWLRLKFSLSELLVEVERGCLVWYHRQLREVAGEAYQSHRVAVCSVMGQYFSNSIAEDVQTARKITKQSWLLCQRQVIDPQSLPNVRRCAEAGQGFLKAGRWQEATLELCCLPSVGCRLRAGFSFQLIGQLLQLQDLMQEIAKEYIDEQQPEAFVQARQRVYHYSRWLQQDVYHLNAAPLSLMFSSAALQPLFSCVRADALTLMQSIKTSPELLAATASNFHFSFPLKGASVFDALLFALNGHKRYITAVEYSSDGRWVIAGAEDGSVRIWEDRSGELLRSFAVKENRAVSCIAYNAVHQLLACGLDDFDTPVHLWRADTGTLLKTFKIMREKVVSVAVHPDGQLIAFCHENRMRFQFLPMDRQAYVFDIASGEVMFHLADPKGAIVHLMYHPAGEELWTLSHRVDGSGQINVWSARTSEMLVELNRERLIKAAMSSDGNVLVTCESRDLHPTVVVWDTTTKTPIRVIEDIAHEIQSISINANGRVLAYKSFDRFVACVDLSSDDATVTKFPLDYKYECGKGVALNPAGTRVASASAWGVLSVWDVKFSQTGHQDWGKYLSVGLGKTLAVVAQERGKPQICHVNNGVLVKTIENAAVEGAVFVQLTPDDRFVIACGKQGLLISLNAVTGSLEGSFEMCCDVSGTTGATMSKLKVNYSGDLVASGFKDGCIKVWSVPTRGLLFDLHANGGHLKQISCLEFSHDGLKLASSSRDHNLIIWSLQTGGEILWKINLGNDISSLSFSPNDERLAVGMGGDYPEEEKYATTAEWESHAFDKYAVSIFHVSSRRREVTLESSPTFINDVSFSADGNHVMSAVGSHLQVWDVSVPDSATKIIELNHREKIHALLFSRDNRHILSMSNNQVLVWDFSLLRDKWSLAR